MSCSSCGAGSPVPSSGPCACSCSTVDCNPDTEMRLEWCEKASLYDKVNPYPHDCTMCNLDTECNLFFTKQPGYKGRCILDEMTFDQVLAFLSSNPHAKEHMLRITNDPCLVKMALGTELVTPIPEQNQEFMKRVTGNSIPYYTLFKGNTGGDIRRK